MGYDEFIKMYDKTTGAYSINNLLMVFSLELKHNYMEDHTEFTLYDRKYSLDVAKFKTTDFKKDNFKEQLKETLLIYLERRGEIIDAFEFTVLRKLREAGV